MNPEKVTVAVQGCLAILRAGLIVHRVNATAALFPGVVAAPLVIGTIAGCGGKVIVDAIDVACQTKKGAASGGLLWHRCGVAVLPGDLVGNVSSNV